MHKSIFIRSRGGRISISRLQNICKLAITLQMGGFQINHRQEIVITDTEAEINKLKEVLKREDIVFSDNSDNAISSIMTFDIFPSTQWLNQGVFSKVIVNLPEDLGYSVSFLDTKQNYVQQLESQFNFIASEELNFWHLVVHDVLNTKKPYIWPVVIGTEAITPFLQALKKELKNNTESLLEIANALNTSLNYTNKVADKSFKLKEENPTLPDGFYGLNPTYLFIKQQNILFHKCDNLMSICKNENMQYVYLSPWSSLVVGPILDSRIQEWEHFLNKENIGTGKAYRELNWRYEGVDKDLYKLKKRLITFFYDTDLRFNGLSFSLFKPGQKPINSSIQIMVKSYLAGFLASYTLIDNFFGESNIVGQNLSYKELKQQIDSLVKIHQKRKQGSKVEAFKEENFEDNQLKKKQYSCKECLTMYSPELGSISEGILPNTPFEMLSDNFSCPTCGSPKEAFQLQ